MVFTRTSEKNEKKNSMDKMKRLNPIAQRAGLGGDVPTGPINSIMPEEAQALEPAAPLHRRREIEGVVDEFKTHLHANRRGAVSAVTIV